jgi:hypothetical protein
VIVTVSQLGCWSVGWSTFLWSLCPGGVPERDLALPLTEPARIGAHGLLRELAPLMLLVHRWRDGREIA